MRRIRIYFLSLKHKNVWPINEKAGNPPAGWSGWPEGKKFALVLTHDVETGMGQSKCLNLMNLEKRLGFKSTFFFVPESYVNDRAIHNELLNNGYEVGIHGLNHDGKLYFSEKIFTRRAVRINHYISEWMAKGFRSPCMHHNLEWIQKLNIAYDASTYDTDPFEPQGGGENTIFPFIVEDKNSDKFYVELPYTLPQDFLLYVLMKKKTIDVWKKKLDWIVNKGGMALVIAHPDYMNFNASRVGYEEYPENYYSDLLKYIKTEYEGQYWNVTSAEMAEFWAKSEGRVTADLANKRKICMLVFSFYPSDVRVRREARALAEAGHEVDVICLRDNDDKKNEVVNGVQVYRLPMSRKRKGRMNYMWEYFCFITIAFFRISMLHLKNRYDIVHIHNMPDVLVFSAMIPKLAGSKIVLDLHDPTPEVYMAKYNILHTHPIIKFLCFCEKICIRLANHVITPNISFRDLFISRGCPSDKIDIVMNSPQENVFFNSSLPENVKDLSGSRKFTMMFHGTIVERHGLDTALHALRQLVDKIPGIEFLVYGDGDFVERIMELRNEYKLNDIVHYHGPVSLEEIAATIRTIDVGLIPNKQSPFTEINMPTRIFEYLCLGKPVIAPRTRGILDYFNDDEIYFFEPGNSNSLADAILDIYSNPDKRKQKIKRGMEVYSRHAWKLEKKNLIKIVNNLR